MLFYKCYIHLYFLAHMCIQAQLDSDMGGRSLSASPLLYFETSVQSTEDEDQREYHISIEI